MIPSEKPKVICSIDIPNKGQIGCLEIAPAITKIHYQQWNRKLQKYLHKFTRVPLPYLYPFVVRDFNKKILDYRLWASNISGGELYSLNLPNTHVKGSICWGTNVFYDSFGLKIQKPEVLCMALTNAYFSSFSNGDLGNSVRNLRNIFIREFRGFRSRVGLLSDQISNAKTILNKDFL